MNDEGSDRSIKNERQHQVARGVGATSMSLIHGNCGIQFFEYDIADLVFEAVLKVVRPPSDCESGLIRRLPATSCASVVSAQHISMHLEHFAGRAVLRSAFMLKAIRNRKMEA
jgi:hypothetical protein